MELAAGQWLGGAGRAPAWPGDLAPGCLRLRPRESKRLLSERRRPFVTMRRSDQPRDLSSCCLPFSDSRGKCQPPNHTLASH